MSTRSSAGALIGDTVTEIINLHSQVKFSVIILVDIAESRCPSGFGPP